MGGRNQIYSAIGGGRVTGGEEETQIAGDLHRVSTWDNWGCRNSVHHHTGDISGERYQIGRRCAADEQAGAPDKDSQANNERYQGAAARTEGGRQC